MSTLLAGLVMVGGTVFMLIAAIGLLRLPDLYTRMHAVTKAGTLGVGLLLVSAAVAFGDVSVTTRTLVALLFVLLTAPVSAHMIGRAGYLGKVQLWEGTAFDDWRGSYETLQREGEEEASTTAPDPDQSASTAP
jgi:multicomponent Na+:H+ antiporter subunit G